MEPYESDDPRLPLFTAIGIAITDWANVEIGLATLFATCVGAKDIAAATRAFWAVTAFEGKLKMANESAHVYFSRFDESFQSEWNRLYNRLTDKNAKRNAIAHGRVSSDVLVTESGSTEGPPYLQPYAGTWIFGSIKRDREGTLPYGPNAPDRMSLEDVQIAAHTFRVLASELITLTSCAARRAPLPGRLNY